MRTKLAFLFCFIAVLLIAQNPIVLPDTIASCRLQSYSAIKHIGSQHRLDTITHPKIFIIQEPRVWSTYGYIELARLERDSFRIYPLNVMASRVEIQRQQINGQGNQEVIITWFYDENISRWGDWHYFHEQGIIILDPDSMNVLLSLVTHDSKIAIWETYYPDSSGPNGELVPIEGGSESSCWSCNFTLNTTGFTVYETADCPEQEDWEMNNYQITDNNKYEYVFTPSGYVRVK